MNTGGGGAEVVQSAEVTAEKQQRHAGTVTEPDGYKMIV